MSTNLAATDPRETTAVEPRGVVSPRLQIATAVFEGPLEILVALAERDDIDLLQVSLAALTDSYLVTLQDLPDRDPAEMANFLWMAARLLHLKSLRLLPGEEPNAEEMELLGWEEEVRGRLQEYRTYKDLAARWLVDLGVEAVAASYPAPAREVELDGQEYPIEANLLLVAFQSVLTRIPPRPYTMVRRTWTMDEKVELLLGRLATGPVDLVEVLLESEDRLEAVVTFVSLLELLRRGRVRVTQPEPFGPVWITSR
ncbi:MAG TPA: ScpA family protein [Candidatus Dormibacteraeota bacterium]|jgi:segregation and condensation protein A|nr:ScpA family protein [Candidatus Dormibacteraeota bacterium]